MPVRLFAGPMDGLPLSIQTTFISAAGSGAPWGHLEEALAALGAGVSSGRGEHVRVAFRGRRGVLQRRSGAAFVHPLEVRALAQMIRGEPMPAPLRPTLLRIEPYGASVDFDPEAEMFRAQATDIPDMISAWGRNASGLRETFAAALEDYLWFCKARGEAPALPARAGSAPGGGAGRL